MGLLDCVSDTRTGKYPVSPPAGQAPLVRGNASDMGSRRSLGKKALFSSTSSIKNKDIDFWWNRVLCFLYKSEGREDIRELRMPLRQLGYNTIGDFIRDIPAAVYQPYQSQITPDETLRKDCKVIWEKDGIAEPGAFKWEGTIEGQKCMGLQLDRKKAVPFGTYDGKGLFYCKPGHRALVPASEVVPYKKFLREFLGLPPRKDSMQLNLLPGRSSVRVAVAKKYKPGDRVHLPNEKKWATILWTGRIGGEWVVDLVYDPEKPATGKMASPDEPCMSRSLSMAEFIDQIGDPTTPPAHVPPPPPPPKKLADPDDDVFVSSNDTPPRVVLQDDGLPSVGKDSESDVTESDEDATDNDDDDSLSDLAQDNNKDPGVESGSESDASQEKRRTFSEPVPERVEIKKQELKNLEIFEPEPLKFRPTHKPLFNLASFGRKKKRAQKETEQLPPPVQKVPSPAPKKTFHSPKNNLLFFKSKSKSKSPTVKTFAEVEKSEEKEVKPLSPPTPVKDPKSVTVTQTPEASNEPSSSFHRRDRSRSPVNKKLDKKRLWSGDHREIPIDVPVELQTPERREAPVIISDLVVVNQRRKSSSDVSDSAVKKVPTPVKVGIPDPNKKSKDMTPEPSPRRKNVTPSPKSFIEPRHQESSEESCTSDEDDDEKLVSKQPIEQKMPESVQVKVSVEINQPSTTEDKGASEYYSDSTPPYSPVIKDVGLRMKKPRRKKEEKQGRSTNSPLKSLGSFFSPKKKALPPKDYEGIEEFKPEPPVRKESLGDDSDDSVSVASDKGHQSPKEKYERVFEDETIPKRKSSLGFSSGFKKPRKPSATKTTVETISPILSESQKPKSPTHDPEEKRPRKEEQLGDQEGLILDSLEVKDDQPPWSSPPPVPVEDTVSKRKSSTGKSFSFGFSKKPKPTGTLSPKQDHDNTKSSKVSKHQERSSFSDMSLSSQDNVKVPGVTPPTNDIIKNSQNTKSKRSSFKDTFTRTFSFTREKRKSSIELSTGNDNEEKNKASRPLSLYIDNNEAIGVPVQNLKPKSKSTSALVDIQPWNERRGNKKDLYEIYDSGTEETSPRSAGLSPKSPTVPALLPKQSDTVPKHRIFTTPRSFFGFSSKSTEEIPTKPKKKNSFKGSKIPKSVSAPKIVAETEPLTSPETPDEPKPPLPKSEPPKLPSNPPPKVPPESPSSPTGSEDPYVSSTLVRKLKSAMKQRKEIDAIPKGVKIGDRVIWYNGRIPIPGTVMKLYKDGTDKYTAVVKFDRIISTEPLSLTREGDAYIVTVEELITPEVFGIPASSVPISSQISTSIEEQEPTSDLSSDAKQTEKLPTQSVRFKPEQEHKLPEINIELPTPGTPKEGFENDETVPPPFQEEEVDLACGVRRGVPSHDKSCCIETLLFSMFYTTNTFDISILYQNGFEEQTLTGDIKTLLRQEIVHPLRQSGFCEYAAVKKLNDFVKSVSPDFNAMSTDAEIMIFNLFERALKLGKFISYSTEVTDYLHQLALDPRDHSKSNTIQHLFETSLKHMDNAKLKSIPTPALILEIPRANDKLIQYEAIIPNLTLVVSHLLENGPRLCICGVAAKYECQTCFDKYAGKAVVFCDNCKSMADQIHFQLEHEPLLVQMAQSMVTMDLVAVICVTDGHYTSFVKCGSQRSSPWLFYDGTEIDNPKVSLEQNLGMWIDRLEKYPGKYHEAFTHSLLTHFLANSHICIYQSREKSSLV